MANQVAYGFESLKTLFARRVTEIGVAEVAGAIEASVAEHNRQVDALLGLFVRRTTDFKTRFRATAASGRLQPLDENGRARPIRLGGQYDISLPLQMAGTAWGADFVTRQYMTVGEANEYTLALTAQDARWMRDHILAALFYNSTGWTFTDDLHGALTILGLANADAQTYSAMTGADAPATDTHYLAQAAAISDAANPLPTIRTELMEHPENGGEVVALVPSNLRAATEALATFYPQVDRNVNAGANAATLVGDLGVAVPGEVYGYADKVWLAEWRSLPDNYIVAVATEGERALAMREDPIAALQGFKAVAERDDYPWWERQYIRRAGFGGWNRVAAVVQRVSNGSYAIPTGYTSPMP